MEMMNLNKMSEILDMAVKTPLIRPANWVALQPSAWGHSATQVWPIFPSVSIYGGMDRPNRSGTMTLCFRSQHLKWGAGPTLWDRSCPCRVCVGWSCPPILLCLPFQHCYYTLVYVAVMKSWPLHDLCFIPCTSPWNLLNISMPKL